MQSFTSGILWHCIKKHVLPVHSISDNLTSIFTDQKAKLKKQLKADNGYIATIEKWEKEKAGDIKHLEQSAKKANPLATKKESTEIIQS